MNIVDMAHVSKFAVILDGRIGREEYQSMSRNLHRMLA
jgi:hypothetical protein